MDTDHFTILDTPGLGDLNMTIECWAAKLNNSEFKSKKVALALMVIKAKVRPSTEDRMNMRVLQSAITNVKPENLCCVITFCDEDPETYNMEQTMNFLSELFSFLPDIK